MIPVFYLTILDYSCSNLYNFTICGIKTRCLKVKDYNFIGKFGISNAFDRSSLCNIVDSICFYAINNFNIIYFLTRGGPATLDYYQAGKTDLLVTWLYKLTVNSKDYSYAATIGILVFIISAVFSLMAYRRTSSYKNEEEFG